MIHIMKVREYTDKRTGDVKLALTPYEDRKGGSVKALFENLDAVLSKIPTEDRWNLHYTLANMTNVSWKWADAVMDKQEVMPFDLDGIDVERKEEYIAIVEDVLKISRVNMGVVSSGHGLHFLIGLKKPIASKDYFRIHAVQYKYICGEITQRMYLAGLEGEVDSGPFRYKATLRLPGTINRKEGKPDVECELLYSKIKPVAWNWNDYAPSGAEEEVDPTSELKHYPKPDTEAVQECPFLRWTKDNQHAVKEPQWYAMMTIVSKLENGMQLCHEYSSMHPCYDAADTENKAVYAKEAGPRTCGHISTLWDGCEGCPHHTKLASPIILQGENYIGTEETGFHDLQEQANGNVKQIPNYEDLRRKFQQTHPYITIAESGVVYTHNGKYWEKRTDVELRGFATRHFKPIANNTKRAEFINLVMSTNLVTNDWFTHSTNGKMNFRNGVLDLETMEFKSHSIDYGFLSVLDYDYNPSALCPTFDRYMQDITVSDQSMIDLLLEYAGYAFSGDPCKYEKALILYGGGSNGKSTFIRLLKHAAGKEAYSSLKLNEFSNDQSRVQLVGKLFNISEETPSKRGFDSSNFKDLISGGDYLVKEVYKTPYKQENKTKLILACNELMDMEDTTHGMFRKMFIVPFDACFEGVTKDYDIFDKMEAELSGIFNRIIDGYSRLKMQNGFTNCTRIATAIDEYRLISDTVLTWTQECISAVSIHDVDYTLSMGDAYTKYCFEMDRRQRKKETYKTFAGRMTSLYHNRVRGKTRKEFVGLQVLEDMNQF